MKSKLPPKQAPKATPDEFWIVTGPDISVKDLSECSTAYESLHEAMRAAVEIAEDYPAHVYQCTRKIRVTPSE